MSDIYQRSTLLWGGMGIATISHLFILWFPKRDELEIRDRENQSIFFFKFRFLYRVALVAKRCILLLLALSLVANELSHIYFGGHTGNNKPFILVNFNDSNN